MSRRSDSQRTRPRSLFDPPQAQESRRFLTEPECRELADRTFGFIQGEGGSASLGIASWWSGELRWARNRVSLASDRRGTQLNLWRTLSSSNQAFIRTNQTDDDALRAAVRAAEQIAAGIGTQRRLPPPDLPLHLEASDEPPAEYEALKPEVFSERTYNLSGDRRGEIARAMVEPAEAAGMLAAGYLQVRGESRSQFLSPGRDRYMGYTAAQCSMTVRDPTGNGSGWAGLSSWDWGRIDPRVLAERAVEKCLASRNPVALEPGRYTVILEPQAVHDITRLVFGALQGRPGAEIMQFGPFAAGRDATGLGMTKIGLKVMDERITIGCDPMDPDLAAPSFDGFQRVTWVENGILKRLGYGRGYSLPALNENDPLLAPGYSITPGQTTLEEMIATTRRGLLVTRFSNVDVLDQKSVLSTGLTRDGLWLIENGKITKAVKNFRFTESPMFMLNSIEQVGTPAVPVFSPGAPAVVPPLKARDFSFTSLIDAI